MTALVVIAFAVALGYALKGATGFAEAIPVAAVGPLVLPIPEVVTLITLMDLFAGVVILPTARVPLFVRTEWRRAVAVGGGTFLGIWLLAVAPVTVVHVGVIVVLAGTAAWVVHQALLQLRVARVVSTREGLVVAARSDGLTGGVCAVADVVHREVTVHPVGGSWSIAHLRARVRTGAGCLLAGLTGGLSGLDGPPMFAALSRRGTTPAAVRDQVMRLLLLSAVLRLALLAGVGQIHWADLGHAIGLVPIAAGAFLLGRRGSHAWSPTRTALVSAAVCLVGVSMALFA